MKTWLLTWKWICFFFWSEKNPCNYLAMWSQSIEFVFFGRKFFATRPNSSVEWIYSTAHRMDRVAYFPFRFYDANVVGTFDSNWWHVQVQFFMSHLTATSWTIQQSTNGERQSHHSKVSLIKQPVAICPANLRTQFVLTELVLLEIFPVSSRYHHRSSERSLARWPRREQSKETETLFLDTGLRFLLYPARNNTSRGEREFDWPPIWPFGRHRSHLCDQ